MKKILLAALLAVGIAQVQAAPYDNIFYDGSPAESEVTITFSGYCSGKITDVVGGVSVIASDDPANQASYAEATVGMLGNEYRQLFLWQSCG